MKALQVIISFATLLMVLGITTIVARLERERQMIDANFWLGVAAVILLTALVVRALLQDLSGKPKVIPETGESGRSDSLKKGETR